MHLDADAGLLYVANGSASTTLGGTVGWSHTEDGRLSVIDTATLAITDTIELGKAPSMLAVDPGARAAVVAAPEGDGAVVALLAGPCSVADFVEPFGTLDFFDVQAFLQAFSDHDPSADLTGDGLFDFFDVQDYLNAFSDGCP
jgi:YVTN family beta-propeller protein